MQFDWSEMSLRFMGSLLTNPSASRRAVSDEIYTRISFSDVLAAHIRSPTEALLDCLRPGSFLQRRSVTVGSQVSLYLMLRVLILTESGFYYALHLKIHDDYDNIRMSESLGEAMRLSKALSSASFKTKQRALLQHRLRTSTVYVRTVPTGGDHSKRIIEHCGTTLRRK